MTILQEHDLLPKSVRHLGASVGLVVKEGNPGPKRIQRKRTKGWRMPEGAIYVGRPSKYGNPFKVGTSHCDGEGHWWPAVKDKAHAADLFRQWANTGDGQRTLGDLSELRGHDLVCWCPLDQDCHADTLLELANA